MVDRASVYALAQRRRRQWPGDTLLFPQDIEFQHGRDGSKKPITPIVISKGIAGGMPKRACQAWDERHMHEFCVKNSLDHVTVPSSISHADLFPAGSSFLDFLVLDLKRVDAWRFPGTDKMSALFKEMQNTRGVNLGLVDRVSVWEIVVGVTPADEIDRCVNWYTSNHQRNQLDYPTKLLSLDNEEIPVPREIYDQILAGKPGEIFSFPIRIKKGTKCCQMPVKIMIGDGMTWAIMITILVRPGSNGQHSFTVPKLQPNLVQFLKSWPIVTGVGVTSDFMEIETLFGAWTSDPSFRLEGFLELGPLSVLAGNNIGLTNMPTLSIQLLGGMLNKSVSTGDNVNWGLPWGEVPKSLKAYCLADVKFGYQAAVVLLRMLLIDMFPDPDIVLSFVRKDSFEFTCWFNCWVTSTLAGVVVHSADIAGQTTRQGLSKALRYWIRGKGMSKATPSRVTALVGLFGDWPSLPNGGCRYMHQARTYCLTQFEELKRLDLPGWNNIIMPYEISDEMKEAATYTVPHLHTVCFKEEARGNHGLVCHSDLHGETLLTTILVGKDLSSAVVIPHARSNQRVAREVVYEWLRFNLEQVPSFFTIILKDRHYSKYLRTFYSEAREIYRRCTGKIAPRNKGIDAEIANRTAFALNKEKEHVAVLRLCLEARLKRVTYYSEVLEDDDTSVPCITWRSQVPPYIGRKKLAAKRSRTEFTPDEPAREFSDALRDDPIDNVDMVEPDEERGQGRHVAKKKKGYNAASDGPAANATQDVVEEFVVLETRASNSPEFYQGRK